MKSLILISLIFSSSIFAEELVCKGSTDSYKVQFEQVTDGVTATLQNLKPRNYRNVSTREDGSFKVTGNEISTTTIYKIDLPTLMLKPRLAQELFVLMILARRDFDGEYDMMYSYASDFFHALKCD